VSRDGHPERIVPDDTEPGIVALHRKRYEFALPFCDGRDVLDAGCGVGYGTALLADRAKRVVGVDVDARAVTYARERYARENVDFREGDVQSLDLPDASFDVVCSFETIEHVPDRDAFVAEMRRLLRPGGVFLASTPRVERTELRPVNPHHEVELAPADFEALLRTRFGEVELYGQRRLQTRRHRLLQRLDVLGLRRRLRVPRALSRVPGTAPMAQVASDGVVIERDALAQATEIVALCR
jgi:SAM-dependent methyltransferase